MIWPNSATSTWKFPERRTLSLHGRWHERRYTEILDRKSFRRVYHFFHRLNCRDIGKKTDSWCLKSIWTSQYLDYWRSHIMNCCQSLVDHGKSRVTGKTMPVPSHLPTTSWCEKKGKNTQWSLHSNRVVIALPTANTKTSDYESWRNHP